MSDGHASGAPRPANGFVNLLHLATAAFGDERDGESWLLTENPEWSAVPLYHARTPEGFREVEGALRALIERRAARRTPRQISINTDRTS